MGRGLLRDDAGVTALAHHLEPIVPRHGILDLVVNMTKGDEMLSGLTEFAEKYHIRNGHFTALGAINKGLFGWTDVERGIGQKKIELNEEAEIVSLMGSISVNAQGQSNVHAHGTVALSDGTVKGGHWWEARVSIIAEVFVTEEEGASDPTK